MNYILKDKNPIPCPDILEWEKWFEKIDNRIVKKDDVGKFHVSTVFLGMDHSFGRGTTPILFETMIFDNSKDGLEKFDERYCDRYHFWEEAKAGHEIAVKKAKEMLEC